MMNTFADHDDSNEIANSQKKLIDDRLQSIHQNPEKLRPVEEFFSELNSEETKSPTI